MPTDFELAPWLYPLLCLTGLAAGFVDSIVGGGLRRGGRFSRLFAIS